MDVMTAAKDQSRNIIRNINTNTHAPSMEMANERIEIVKTTWSILFPSNIKIGNIAKRNGEIGSLFIGYLRDDRGVQRSSM